jgi:hypothetical protein
MDLGHRICALPTAHFAVHNKSKAENVMVEGVCFFFHRGLHRGACCDAKLGRHSERGLHARRQSAHARIQRLGLNQLQRMPLLYVFEQGLSSSESDAVHDQPKLVDQALFIRLPISVAPTTTCMSLRAGCLIVRISSMSPTIRVLFHVISVQNLGQNIWGECRTSIK